MKKQVKLYLSKDAVDMVEREKKRTTLPLSTIVELLIRQHLTNGGVVPATIEAPVEQQDQTKQDQNHGSEAEDEALLDEGKGYTPYY